MQDITFQLRAGERLVVAGDSGSGKSVLLRALARLDGIDAGELLWQGASVDPAGIPAYRSQVVYLHQRPAFFDGTVLSNLQMPFQLHQHRQLQFDLERVRGWLARLGRDDRFLQQSADDLSGGESQIVALLRAVQLDPRVLLFDEPTASADAKIAASIEEMALAWLEQDAARALIWVTHDAGQADRMGQRELVLRQGKMV